jgi:hypothetical protein
MRAPCAAVLCTIVLTGCGSDRKESESAPPPSSAAQPAATRGPSGADVRAALPRMTRELIPNSALRSVRPGELKVEECGISPTFPCTDVFFAFDGGRGLDARIRSLRALGEREGWRVEGVKRSRTGAYLDLVRAAFHARYTLGDGLPRPGASFVQLAVFGPAAQLRRPSEAERRGWSELKRRYVRDANAVCSRTLGRLSDPDDLAPMLADTAKQLAALDPPPREEAAVRTFLRPLRNLARSARALTDEDGEDTLPAVVGVGEFSKRFIEAASRYGLDKCVL